MGRLRTTCALAVTTCCGSRGFAVGEWEIVLLYNSEAHLRCGLFVSVSNPVMTIVARSAQPGNRVACFGKPVLVPWGHRAYLTRIWYTSTLPPLLAALQGPWGAAGRSTAAVVGPDLPPPERVSRSGTCFLLTKQRARPPVAQSSPRALSWLGSQVQRRGEAHGDRSYAHVHPLPSHQPLLIWDDLVSTSISVQRIACFETS